MSILSITTDFAGQVGVNPRLVRLISDDVISTIVQPGYLNNTMSQGFTFYPTDMIFINYSPNNTPGLFAPQIADNGAITLTQTESGVLGPTTIDNIAIFANTDGSITGSTTSTATAGALQAGYDAQAGTITIYPATTASGAFKLEAEDSSGDFDVTLANTAVGQDTVITLPDPGVSSASILLDNSASGQTIATGDLSLTLGSFSATAISVTGLTGATAASRYIGATVSGAPVSGAFVIGDFVVDQTGTMWICTADGSPGTWTNVGSAASHVNSVFGRTGSIVAQTGDYTAAQVTNAASLVASGTQTFANGLTITSGNVTLTSGNFQAGSSGNAGFIELFPSTASSGKMDIKCANSSGNFTITIQNASFGQASTLTIPDPGLSSSSFIIANKSGTQSIDTAAAATTLSIIGNGTGSTTYDQLTVKSHTTPTVKMNIGVDTATNAGGIDASGALYLQPNGTSYVGIGSNGHQAPFLFFPPAANNGYFEIFASNSTANFATYLTNSNVGQLTTYNLTDPHAAACYVQVSTINSDPCANLMAFDVLVGIADLNSGGTKTLFTSSGSKQYKIRALYCCINPAFTGGGGNRNINITDGTTVYSTIPAASLGSTGNFAWGSTALPFNASAGISLNTSTAAGASLYATYSGGTTDYNSAGGIIITAIMQRVA